MSLRKAVRAWEDPEYRSGLSAAELADLPDNPAGVIELTEAELGQVLGGAQRGESRAARRCPAALVVCWSGQRWTSREPPGDESGRGVAGT
jgi:mersacidin/lichenicidin family type 2 lantibiotic